MLREFRDRNKFGGKTIELGFDEVNVVRIQETNDDSYLVEYREFMVLYWKTHFTFISSKSLEETVIETLNRMYTFHLSRKNDIWTIDQKEGFQKEILDEIRRTMT